MIMKSLIVVIALTSVWPPLAARALNDQPEPAPIVERQLDFFDFTLKSTDGKNFNLREYTTNNRLIVVAFIAGWCPTVIRMDTSLKGFMISTTSAGLALSS